MSGDWVQEHAAELGAIRVGDGPKGTLRFDLRRVKAAVDQRRLEQPGDRIGRHRSGPARGAQGVELAPAARPPTPHAAPTRSTCDEIAAEYGVNPSRARALVYKARLQLRFHCRDAVSLNADALSG